MTTARITGAPGQAAHTHAVHACGPFVLHHAPIGIQHVLAANHLLHHHRCLPIGHPVARRVRLMPGCRVPRGAAAASPIPVRLLSLLVCICFGHRALRADSACLVRPFAACSFTATMASADFCRRSRRQTSQGKTRDFRPICPPHLLPSGPGDYRASDLFASSPTDGCLICGSCSSGRDFAFSFLQTPPRGDALAGRLRVPVTTASGGTYTLPATSRLGFPYRLQAPAISTGASRHAWPTKKQPRGPGPRGYYFVCAEETGVT